MEGQNDTFHKPPTFIAPYPGLRPLRNLGHRVECHMGRDLARGWACTHDDKMMGFGLIVLMRAFIAQT